MRTLWRNNGLSISLFAFFIALLVGQALTGHRQNNEEQRAHGQPQLTLGAYLKSPSFIEVTAENWESEFLQMSVYVLFTVWLYQRGSVESKDPDKKAEVDREPDPKRKGAPGPVKRGGVILKLYSNSLALVFFTLFAISFVLHAYGGAAKYNAERALHGEADALSLLDYLQTSRFWFESLQNWQSEFLAVLSIVVLSIFLRQHGSPESKPVDAPHSQTGEE